MNLKPVSDDVARACIASILSVDEPTVVQSLQPHPLAPFWRPLKRGVTYKRIAALKVGQAELVSIDPTETIRRVSRWTRGRYDVFRKRRREYVVERVG